MRTATLFAFGVLAAMAASLPAQAESQQERLHQNLNRSMQDQQRQQQNIQQNQFETNQLRQTIDRNSLFPQQPALPGPGPGFDRR